MTKDEGLIEELKEQIEELENDLAEANQSVEDLQEENSALDIENDQLREFEVDKEEFAKKAFDAGFSCSIDDSTSQLKEWLNYKIQERI